jgi:hypothetical protein
MFHTAYVMHPPHAISFPPSLYTSGPSVSLLTTSDIMEDIDGLPRKSRSAHTTGTSRITHHTSHACNHRARDVPWRVQQRAIASYTPAPAKQLFVV